MSADPKYSAGARFERAAFRAYLRRKIARLPVQSMALESALEWCLQRQQRYDRRAGGLGKKGATR